MIDKLAPKEREILGLASKGFTDRQISLELSLSRGTLITYWARIKGKLGAATRGEMIAMLVRHDTEVEMGGLASPDEFGQVRADWLLDRLPEGVVVWGGSDQIVFANEGFAAMVEQTVEPVLGKSVRDLDLCSEFIEGLVSHLHLTREVGDVHRAVLCHDGLDRKARLEFVSAPAHGREGWIVSTVREGIAGEAGFHEGLREIVRTGPDLVIGLDALGTVVFANEAVFRVLRKNQLGGEPWTVRDVFAGSDMPMIAEEIIPIAIRDGSWKGVVNVGPAGASPIAMRAVFIGHRDMDRKVSRLTMIGQVVEHDSSLETPVGAGR